MVGSPGRAGGGEHRAAIELAGIFELTWAKDGRATFEYGEPIREGEPDVFGGESVHTRSSKRRKP